MYQTIYILSHKAMPNILKIGFTTRHIKERLKELESTGVPGAFTTELYFETDNAEIFEKLLHKSLKEFHFAKEYFQVDIKTVIKVIHILIKDNKFNFYEFKGESKKLAITQEQIEEQKIQFSENRRKAELKAVELRDKYLNATEADLIANVQWLSSQPSYANLKEAKEVLRIIAIKREQKLAEHLERVKLERAKWEDSNEYKSIQKNQAIYESQFKEKYIELGCETHRTLKSLSPNINTFFRKITNQKLILSFNDGKQLAVFLQNIQLTTTIKKFVEFSLMMIEVKKILGDYRLNDLNIQESNLLITPDKTDVTEYFKGILAHLQPK